MTTTYRLSITADGGVRIDGHDTGKLTIVQQTGDIIVLKEAGSKHFVGLGRPYAYDPSQYRVFHVEETGLTSVICTEVTSFPVRS